MRPEASLTLCSREPMTILSIKFAKNLLPTTNLFQCRVNSIAESEKSDPKDTKKKEYKEQQGTKNYNERRQFGVKSSMTATRRHLDCSFLFHYFERKQRATLTAKVLIGIRTLNCNGFISNMNSLISLISQPTSIFWIWCSNTRPPVVQVLFLCAF